MADTSGPCVFVKNLSPLFENKPQRPPLNQESCMIDSHCPVWKAAPAVFFFFLYLGTASFDLNVVAQFAANKTADTFSAKWFNWPDDMLGSFLEMASVVKA